MAAVLKDDISSVHNDQLRAAVQALTEPIHVLGTVFKKLDATKAPIDDTTRDKLQDLDDELGAVMRKLDEGEDADESAATNGNGGTYALDDAIGKALHAFHAIKACASALDGRACIVADGEAVSFVDLIAREADQARNQLDEAHVRHALAATHRAGAVAEIPGPSPGETDDEAPALKYTLLAHSPDSENGHRDIADAIFSITALGKAIDRATDDNDDARGLACALRSVGETLSAALCNAPVTARDIRKAGDELHRCADGYDRMMRRAAETEPEHAQ